MDYIDYLKETENYDKFILFLLALRFTPSETARMAGVTRATVYATIDRNQTLIHDYFAAVQPVLENVTEERKE